MFIGGYGNWTNVVVIVLVHYAICALASISQHGRMVSLGLSSCIGFDKLPGDI
jgi:hypothetical protein